MNPTNVTESIKAVLLNAKRLLEDAVTLEEMSRWPTAYSLAILSQEEHGKAFLLYLAEQQSVPWTEGFRKALRSHKCKQLVALLMDYLQRKDFLELLKEPDRFGGASTLPNHVLDAIHIVLHEHIGEKDRDAWLDSGEKISPLAGRIARGLLDRAKQDGFYVEIGADGAMRKVPTMVTPDRCRNEIARAKRVAACFWINSGEVQAGASFDLPKIIAVFEVLSGAMPIDEFNEHWWQQAV